MTTLRCYRKTAIDERDRVVYLFGLYNVAKAHGGMAFTVTKANLNRESLYILLHAMAHRLAIETESSRAARSC